MTARVLLMVICQLFLAQVLKGSEKVDIPHHQNSKHVKKIVQGGVDNVRSRKNRI